MSISYKLDRWELAGSLGDLGTILPLALGMIMINGLSPLGLFFSVGFYYILSGIYFKVTTPVEPIKVIGAYAIATGVSASQILASGAIMAVFLLIIGSTRAISFVGRYIPKSVIRGIQLTTGVLLISQGVRLMLGTSKFQLLRQVAEPYLAYQSLGPLSLGVLIGVIGGVITLLLLDNKRVPAGLIIVLAGLTIGLLLGKHDELDKLHLGFSVPRFLPFGIPSVDDFTAALLVLAIPQLPMTLGNAVFATTDLSNEYFGEASKRVTYRSLCISMALANLGSFLLGGMPMCHGAGGLAARFRFGARTAGSNLMIGIIFIFLSIFLKGHSLSIFCLLPLSALGVLLLFAGSQLTLTILDVKKRKDLFVTIMILGITLASNLAIGFIMGIALAYVLRSNRISV
jgi:SulP family sulfate permease